jgi:iron complex transport system substrate-binding protein
LRRARRFSGHFILIGALISACFACAQTSFAESPMAAGAVADKQSRVVTDETGRRVTIPADVKRIVSLAPSLTEIIYALGQENRLAGDTDFCDAPAEAKLKPHVGGPQNPSLEAIVALRPDLVVATTVNRWETVQALEHLGIAVYTTDPETVRATLDSFLHVAQILDAQSQGDALVAKLRSRLDALHSRLSDRPLVHVLFVVWENPLISIGQNTFIADALRWAGAESVVLSDKDWPTLSFEEIVRLQPDYLVFANDETGVAPVELQNLRASPAWKNIEAVQLGHIVVVPNAVEKPSPGLVDVIEGLAHQLHPEVFTVERLDSRVSSLPTFMTYSSFSGFTEFTCVL